jgi:hypothetical protein
VLPLDRESVPLHLVSQEPLERLWDLVREVVRQPGFWEIYGGWLAFLFPDRWEETQEMIRDLGIEPTLDLRPLIKQVGLKQVIDQVGLKPIIDQIGLKPIVDQVGLKPIIDQVGLKSVLEALSSAEILAALDLSTLSPQQLDDLKRRLP